MISFSLGFLLAAVVAIIKEHADRQKVVKAMRLIPADRFDLVPEKVITKSWWQHIYEFLRSVGWVVLWIILTWLTIQILAGE